MNMRVITAEAKLRAVEVALAILRIRSGRRSHEVIGLKEIAKDLQARAELPRNLALGELERAMKALEDSKTSAGYDLGKMRSVADVIVRRWPTIQQALEQWGEESAE